MKKKNNPGVICINEICFQSNFFNKEQMDIVKAIGESCYEKGKRDQQEKNSLFNRLLLLLNIK